ncbi:MAG: SgcJ/EcaC family oxidoreductase [Steroidobacteraceae bacterium]
MNRDEGVESSVSRLAEQFATIWNAHDMERLQDLYAEDADFVNVIGMRWTGASEIARMHVLLHESRMRQTTLVSEGMTVRVLAPSVAVVHDTWVLTGDPGAPGWKVGEQRRGILVHVLKLDGAGKWHIAVSQNTDIQDLPNI